MATTAPVSRPTTGSPGSRSVGWSRQATRWASGTDPRRRWTAPPPWAATASGWGWSGPGWSPSRTAWTRRALARYASIVAGCIDRGIEPLVTLHHFTHPAWLGEDFWLRPDAPDRFRSWVEVAVDVLAPQVRYWVTINEINVLALGSWLLGMFPPGRLLAFGDADVAVDNLLAAHVAGYEVIHRVRPDAVVTTNNSCLSVYEYDRMLTDLLSAPGAWASIAARSTSGWPTRRRLHDSLFPARSAAERLLRRISAVAVALRCHLADRHAMGGAESAEAAPSGGGGRLRQSLPAQP